MSEPAGPSPEELPAKVRTFAGDIVYPRDLRWSFRTEGATFSFNFEHVPEIAQPLITAFKTVLIWYLKERSAHHANAAFFRVLHLIRFLAERRSNALTAIAPVDILNYRGALPPKQEWYVASLSGVLCRWNGLGCAGVPVETADLLRNLRLPGNEKGEAVRTFDPVAGPLTEIEFSGLMNGLSDKLVTKEISEEDFLIVWLTACLGVRPLQLSQLKIKDLGEAPRTTGASWSLDVPRLKQPGTGARTFFIRRPITPTIGAMLHRQASLVLRRFPGRGVELPLFPAVAETRWLSGFEWHRTSTSIRIAIKAAARALCVYSERTGELLAITPRRLRLSLGTRAAAEGLGEYEVAYLLDHTDTQQVKVYVGAAPEIIQRLDEALAFAMAPLAQAFTGHFASPEEMRASPGGVVRGGDVGDSPLGACGENAFCGLAAPVACYTCRQFRPWRDGPHRTVLEKLIAKRERLKETTDMRIATINDRTILAVAEVVRLCSEGGDHG